MWGDMVYYLTGEKMPSQFIGEQIGVVKKKVEDLSEIGEGASNVVDEGTELYSVKEENQGEVIAVLFKTKEGPLYLRAISNSRFNVPFNK